MSSPSYSQNSANLVNTLSSIGMVGAITIASSAKSNNHNYKDSTVISPLILRPLADARSFSSTYLWILSKYTEKSNGEHGHPCFNPIRISINSLSLTLSKSTSALRSTYNIYNAFVILLLSPISSHKTYHNLSLWMESYALRRSTKMANNYSFLCMALCTNVFNIKQLSSTLWPLQNPAYTGDLSCNRFTYPSTKLFRQTAGNLLNTCMILNPR